MILCPYVSLCVCMCSISHLFPYSFWEGRFRCPEVYFTMLRRNLSKLVASWCEIGLKRLSYHYILPVDYTLYVVCLPIFSERFIPANTENTNTLKMSRRIFSFMLSTMCAVTIYLDDGRGFTTWIFCLAKSDRHFVFSVIGWANVVASKGFTFFVRCSITVSRAKQASAFTSRLTSVVVCVIHNVGWRSVCHANYAAYRFSYSNNDSPFWNVSAFISSTSEYI